MKPMNAIEERIIPFRANTQPFDESLSADGQIKDSKGKVIRLSRAYFAEQGPQLRVDRVCEQVAEWDVFPTVSRSEINILDVTKTLHLLREAISQFDEPTQLTQLEHTWRFSQDLAKEAKMSNQFNNALTKGLQAADAALARRPKYSWQPFQPDINNFRKMASRAVAVEAIVGTAAKYYPTKDQQNPFLLASHLYEVGAIRLVSFKGGTLLAAVFQTRNAQNGLPEKISFNEFNL